MIENLISALVVAFAASWVTVRLSLKRFYSERWWERRLDAYSALIEALHRMNRTIEEEFEAARQDRQLSDSEIQEGRSVWADSKREIARATDLASFLLNAEVDSKLRKLTCDLESASRNASDYYDHLAVQQDAITECLTSLTNLAKRDLGVK